MISRWLIIPLLGAFIGWITNVLAIRLLFRPRKPYKFLFWTLQGLIPRRRDELATQIAIVLDRDLLPLEELVKKFKNKVVEDKLAALVGEIVRKRITERLPNFVPLGWKAALGHALEEAARREVPLLLEKVEKELLLQPDNYSLGNIVMEKLKALQLEQVEELVLKVAAKELRYIELLGGILGLAIGFFQALISSW
ncbi:Protein of unknown function [Thermanaeromonas toyohensis ToBE]|uniref:DUF445 domain-containing protein n=1 Tax=Thermanaeromonas toyohensis ToBE TaxID=698762 RepID=A0A1W1W043_9FIRM|nr:DUF445 family protein [Thermanaeromonas toyohensis]SMB99002.1 Protein of unknown function [Thermanaeromonas toyohensis ToBE]